MMCAHVLSTKFVVHVHACDAISPSSADRYLLTSQLQATDARKVFPCLDEPALKATFNVSLDRMASHTTKSNMQIIRTDVG